mmetsp:Transcript_30756/g.62815  ORF Transcript_30756/g.62815 Transcript_30756/m.62815 type:complete len:514 (-) Transcript_30756:179-1720(-)
MHPDDILGSLHLLSWSGDVGNRDGTRIGGKDAMIGSHFLHLLYDLPLEFQIFEYRLDDQIGSGEMTFPRFGLIRQRHHSRGVDVVLVLGHSLSFEFLIPIIGHVGNSSPETGVISVFEKHLIPLLGCHLSDARPHEPGPHDGHLFDGQGIGSHRWLFHLIHPVKDSDERVALFGGRQFGELLSFVFEFGVARIGQTELDAIHNRIRSGIMATRILIHHLLDFIPHDVLSRRRILDNAIHQRLFLRSTLLDGPRGQPLGRLDRHFLQRLRRHDQIHQPHLLGLIGPNVLPRQHHIQPGLDAHQGRQVLRPAKSREQSQFDFRQPHLGGGGVGANAVIAPHGPFEASSQGGAVYRRHQGDALGFHSEEEIQGLFDDGDELGFVLDALDVEDVGSGDEARFLGGGEDDGFDGVVGVDVVVPEGLGFVHEGEAEGVYLLVGVVEADDGDAAGGDFDVLEVFVFAVRGGREGRFGGGGGFGRIFGLVSGFGSCFAGGGGGGGGEEGGSGWRAGLDLGK